jgi:hypothetical protein
LINDHGGMPGRANPLQGPASGKELPAAAGFASAQIDWQPIRRRHLHTIKKPFDISSRRCHTPGLVLLGGHYRRIRAVCWLMLRKPLSRTICALATVTIRH